MNKLMITTSFLILTLSVASFGIATPAQARKAGEGRGGLRPAFSDLDVNGDGQITKADIEARQAARFAAIDTDGNGTLSAQELITAARAKSESRIKTRTEKMLGRRDANGDGVLSAEEIAPKAMPRLFKRLDTDGDGAVSLAEFDAAKTARPGHAKKRRPKGE